MHSRVSHKYYKQWRLNYFIEMQIIDRENFDDEALIRQIRQNFPPSNICAVQYIWIYLQSPHTVAINYIMQLGIKTQIIA